MDGGGSRAAEGGREATRSALDADPDVPTLGGAGTAQQSSPQTKSCTITM
jgi:hypothetical protein